MKLTGPLPLPHPALSDALGCRVDVLDFSGLPTGTHKIFKAERGLHAIKSHHYKKAIALSSGNYARALSHVAQEMRQLVVVAVGRKVAHHKPEVENEFVEVVFIEDLQEAFASQGDLSSPVLSQAYQALKGENPFGGPPDITNLSSIEQIEEFLGPRSTYDVLGGPYDQVFCPNGSGELLYDLAFNTTLSTRFYGVSPLDHPSITGDDFNLDCFPSFADKLVTPTYPLQWSHLQNALDFSPNQKQVTFLGATEEELRLAYQLAQHAGLTVEPSGAAAVSFLVESFRERHHLAIQGKERVLVVNTGKGHSEK